VDGFNESMTICVCNLSDLGRLFVEKDGSVSFSLLSVERSVTSDFVSTWESVGKLSASDVSHSLTVLLCISCIAVLFLTSLFVTMNWDSEDKKRHFLITQAKAQGQQKELISDSIKMKQPKQPSEFVAIVPSQTNPRNRSHANEYLKLIDESLPSIFKSDSLWNKFKEEVQVYHRWLGIVFYYSPVFPRSMRVLSLFSSIVIMLFVQSVTYNIADPDDGSCESCEDDSCCMSLRSTLNSNEDRCSWETSSTVLSSSDGSCHFREISNDMSRVFIVAIFSAVVSAPLALGVQYLICNVLSKEVVASGKVKKKSNLVVMKNIRRLFPTTLTSAKKGDPSMGLVELCGKTPIDDLKNLRNELTVHYNHLLCTVNCKPEEFRGQSLSFSCCYF
jgi:hypothetical protein